jgi:PleD family two-component response regulator
MVNRDQRQIVVLLVDDQAFVAAAVGRLLATEHDIGLHCCLHSHDAVAMANQLNPTIILQDLVMPGIGGLALVGLFRTNPPTAGRPSSCSRAMTIRRRALERSHKERAITWSSCRRKTT